MFYRNLGHTDIKVSGICLGTMTWGSQNNEQDGHDQLDYALGEGINFIDTAEIYAVPPTAETYGVTESIIGSYLDKTKKRNEIILASKIAGPGPNWIRNGQGVIDRSNMLTALEGSLKRLKTDYIDLYQLHWPNRDFYHFQKHWKFTPKFDTEQTEANFVEVLETAAELIKQGKIRYLGLSNESAWGLSKYLDLAKQLNLPRVVSIQNEYSLVCRLFEPDLQEVALAENCGLLAWSPLARGMLSGKYLGGNMPAGSRLSLDPRPDLRSTPACEKAITAYVALAKKHNLDPAQMALAFVNSRPFLTANIIGATTLDQLKSNIASTSIELSPEVLDGIEAIRREYPVPY